MTLLSVADLGVSIGAVAPLDGVAFDLNKGEVLGLVGESGSGKSLTALSILGLLPLIGGRITRGAIAFEGRDLAHLSDAALRSLRGRRIAWIAQNPMTSLDPIQTIGEQIDQVSRLHLGLSKRQARERSIALMGDLRIPDPAIVHGRHPHHLSGGMKQRVVIAMALAGEPDLIVADEPTTALDVTIQAQIVQILADLVRERGVALLLVTHDMGVVAQVCDRVAVLYAGRVAELAPVRDLFAAPRHPYTQALISCVPREGQPPGSLKGIPGVVPGVAHYPSGCRFHPRCARASEACRREVPALVERDGARVACHHALEALHV